MFMPYYPEELIEEVRSRNDIVAVVGSRVKLTRKGANYFGCCPFHNEKTPSFSVSPGKQMYYCFGCGAGGNVLTFLMNYENIGFQEALTELAGRAGITLPQREMTDDERERDSLRARLLAMNSEAAKYYYYLLRQPAGREGLAYFERRGLSRETMRRFGLGYAANSYDGLYRYLKSKGFTDEELRSSGLVRFSEQKGARDYFRDRDMFPIMDRSSRVIGFGGRILGSGEPKYLNSPETPLFDKGRNLYGLHLARSSRREYFLLCEGYMDVISMHQAGFDCAVASLGTSLTAGHAQLFKRLGKPVILCYDSDTAGVKAAMRAIPILREAGIDSRVLNMRPYKDPDEFIVHEGAEAFEKRIAEAENFFLFESDVWKSGFNLQNPAELTAFHRKLAEELTVFTETMERENYLKAVCERHGISAEHMRGLVNGVGNRRYSAEIVAPDLDELTQESLSRAGKGQTGLTTAAEIILCWAATGNAPAERVAELIREEDMPEPLYREIYRQILQEKRTRGSVIPAALINRFVEDEKGSKLVAAVFSKTLKDEMLPAEKSRLLSENWQRLRREALKTALRSEGLPAAQLQQLVRELAAVPSLKIEEYDL